jgi:UDPglucose 6-dehydrogenase
VGLTAAVCLAAAGHSVIGVERDGVRLASLRSGTPPFFEPGMAESLADALSSGALSFTETLAESDSTDVVDVVIVAVGSPQLSSGASDLSQVVSAFLEIAAMPAPPRAVILKSTVPPGTSDRLLAEHSSLRERFVFSPEFLSQGSALRDWKHPSRLVAGLFERRLEPLVADLYRGIDAPLIVTTPVDAEMIKYASNAFLATKISFVNEIANVCEAIGADIEEVTAAMGLDPRIGPKYLGAGIGYGGSCFPKDTRALSYLSHLSGTPMRLLDAVISVNEAQRLRPVSAVRGALARTPGPHAVAVLGLSFKPGTDDVREAPSHGVVAELVASGFEVRAWDPAVDEGRVRAEFPRALAVSTIDEALAGASAACVLTEWPPIVEADWSALAASMVEPRFVFDGRNALRAVDVVSVGAIYQGVGRRARRQDR